MNPLRILLTDDHNIVRDGLKQILRQISDIELIAEAKTGKEALLMVSEKEFDIVVLDISLPDMSGLEVLQSIKKKRPSQSILVLSIRRNNMP
jgi:two-component system invasion response regulator UvrY